MTATAAAATAGDAVARGRPRFAAHIRRLGPWVMLVLVLHGLALRQLPGFGAGPATDPGLVRIELAVVGELALADAVTVGPAAAPVSEPNVPVSVPTWVPVDRPQPSAPAASSAAARDEPDQRSDDDRSTPSVEATAAAPAEPEALAGGEPSRLPLPLPALPPANDLAFLQDPPAVAARETLPMPEPATGASAAAPDTPPGLPPFEWPPSTRLTYVLTGQFRGEVHGRAQVEWVRDGPRYQVHLDVSVGLAVAPLLVRRMSSAGLLTPAGLQPERYEEFTRLAFRDPRRMSMRFEAGQVWLADGRQVPAPAAVQDTASQFVQMAYRFALEPGLLEPGRQVDLALALPRRVDPWVYDVIGNETLATPVGPIDAVHLKPRPIARPGDTLTAEAWFAPRLRYLPVRIRIHQNDETFIDLLLEKLPDVLAPASPPSLTATPTASAP